VGASPPADARRVIGRLARQRAFVLGLVVIVAVAMEATCRLDDLLRYGTPIWSRVVSEDDLLISDRDGEHARPNSRYQKWVINAVGTRGPAAVQEKPPRTLRIVAVGASETFGLYESPGREYPRQLEDSLRRRVASGRCAPSAGAVEVLNAAIFGMSLPTTDADLRTRIRRLDPDIVTIYSVPVQYLTADPPSAAHSDSTGADTILAASRALYPRAEERLRNQLKKMTPPWLLTWLRRRSIRDAMSDPSVGAPYQELPTDRLALYDRDLRRVVATVHTIGAEPILITHANWSMAGAADTTTLIAWRRFYPRSTGPVLLAFDSAGDAAVRRVAADSSVALVDLARTVRDHGGPLFADYAHFTDAGAALAADTIGAAVMDGGRFREWCEGTLRPRQAIAATQFQERGP
jgi:hypothetical protein